MFEFPKMLSVFKEEKHQAQFEQAAPAGGLVMDGGLKRGGVAEAN